jgi:hypothetical protein
LAADGFPLGPSRKPRSPAGHDVVDGVGCGLGGVERDSADKRAIQVSRDAEVEVGFRAGDGGAEVGVGGADLDDGGVSAIQLVPGIKAE